MKKMPLVFVGVVLFVCSMLPSYSQAANSHDLAVVAAADAWWQKSNYLPPVTKAGTVTPAHTITSTKGRVYKMKAHVQTKKEADDEAKDAKFMATRRALIRGFNVNGKTVIALTTLTKGGAYQPDLSPEDLCHSMGAFVWAIPNRHLALENIEIRGAKGELLSSRRGIRGACIQE